MLSISHGNWRRSSRARRSCACAPRPGPCAARAAEAKLRASNAALRARPAWLRRFARRSHSVAQATSAGRSQRRPRPATAEKASAHDQCCQCLRLPTGGASPPTSFRSPTVSGARMAKLEPKSAESPYACFMGIRPNMSPYFATFSVIFRAADLSSHTSGVHAVQ